MRPFRFGAAVAAAEDGRAWLELARRVEGMGYDTLLLPDHLVTPYAPVPALAMAAAVTTTLRVGTMVFANDFRHPAVLAKEAATLHALSDGRFEFGIGAAWHVPEFQAAGIPFDPPGVRIARLEEALAVVKGLWRDEPLTFHGRSYTITEMQGTPSPVDIPVMIGGGARRMLELAAREADIVSLAAHVRRDGTPDISTLRAAAVEERLAWVRAAAGERALELSNYYSTPAVVGPRDEAVARVLDRFAARFGPGHGLTPSDIEASPHFLFGEVPEMIDALVERRERYGFSYVVFTDDVERYEPIVRALAGT